jgi:hypothetical protein
MIDREKKDRERGKHTQQREHGVIYLFLFHTVKKIGVFPSPAGMSLNKLPWWGIIKNYSRPERVWLVTSQLGTGKSLIFFLQCMLACLPMPSPMNVSDLPIFCPWSHTSKSSSELWLLISLQQGKISKNII